MPKPDLRLLIVALLGLTASGLAFAREPKLSKYPLRIHVLASDSTRQMERLTPAESVACDAIGDMLSSISPNPEGPVTLTGVSSDPCLFHSGIVAGRSLDISPYEPVFAGEGRADLVSPPNGTAGISFEYQNCPRVRVAAGFQSLPARWKKLGRILEVLVPSDEIPVDGRPLRPAHCTFRVELHDFVYLLLPNGRIIQVTQQAYWNKASLRVFLQGNSPTIEQRIKQFTVPVSAEQQQPPTKRASPQGGSPKLK